MLCVPSRWTYVSSTETLGAAGSLRRSHAGAVPDKSCSLCWARTTSSPPRPAGTGRRRHSGAYQQAVPLVRRAASQLYYRPQKAAPKLQPQLVEPIKEMIEENPSFGYRTVAGLLGMNKNTVQRIFQLKGWQVKKRPVGFRPRVQALAIGGGRAQPTLGDRPVPHLGRQGWLCHLALVIDCCTRELLGWHLSRSGKSKTAESALEHALINRFGCLGRVPQRFLLRSDNGLVFTSRSYTTLVKSYGFAAGVHHAVHAGAERHGGAGDPHLERAVPHRHRFESLAHASRVIADWIGFYNHRRPHQALGMKTPANQLVTCAERAGSLQGYFPMPRPTLAAATPI